MLYDIIGWDAIGCRRAADRSRLFTYLCVGQRRRPVLGTELIWPARRQLDDEQPRASCRFRPHERRAGDRRGRLSHLRAIGQRWRPVLGTELIWPARRQLDGEQPRASCRFRPRERRAIDRRGRLSQLRAWSTAASSAGDTTSMASSATTRRQTVSCQLPLSGLASGVQAIAAGGYHSCAMVDGGIQCWGYNGDGELGNNSTTNNLVPVSVFGLTSGVQAISRGRLSQLRHGQRRRPVLGTQHQTARSATTRRRTASCQLPFSASRAACRRSPQAAITAAPWSTAAPSAGVRNIIRAAWRQPTTNSPCQSPYSASRVACKRSPRATITAAPWSTAAPWAGDITETANSASTRRRTASCQSRSAGFRPITSDCCHSHLVIIACPNAERQGSKMTLASARIYRSWRRKAGLGEGQECAGSCVS